MSLSQNGRASLRAEPILTVQFLPGCGNCGSPHPLAMKFPPMDPSKCIDCGANVAAPAPPVEVPAIVTGWSPLAILARLLLWVGRKLRSIAKGL